MAQLDALRDNAHDIQRRLGQQADWLKPEHPNVAQAVADVAELAGVVAEVIETLGDTEHPAADTER